MERAWRIIKIWRPKSRENANGTFGWRLVGENEFSWANPC
ncbi:uncharacterized protein G2W53_012433 [Senna tora]|uniref:Uncharacterized protein n=1 Tax=Senna tora TaxID=362788 RepID=A0A834TWX7_9FABA|nr:uncharacterized protein G2W53_012433 [Senna tora]